MHQDPTAILMMYFVAPVWLLAGVADWLSHKATYIERSSGSRESLFHIVMFTEMGLPLLAAIFLEVNALIIAFMITMLVAHELTSFWDVSYAVNLRRVTPLEQHVHSFLELLPLLGLTLIMARHWSQFLALFGLSREGADYLLRAKTEPLPLGYTISLLTAAALVGALYLEELSRCRRAEHRSIQ